MSQEFFAECLENRTLLSGVVAHINFQPQNAPTPAGYVADVGVKFRSKYGFSFGWNVVNKNTVDRNSRLSPDQRYDTFNVLNSGRTAPIWEIAVPNGNCSVHIVAGDPLDAGNTYRIPAERTTIVNGRSNGRKHWLQ